MKIIHFSLEFYPGSGGTASRIWHLIEGDKNRHRLIIPPPPEAIVSRWRSLAREKSITVEERPFISDADFRVRVPVIRRFLKLFINAKKTVQYFPPGWPDLIHAHSPLDFCWGGRKCSLRYGLPLIYEAHIPFVDEVVYPGEKFSSAFLNRLVQPVVSGLESKVIREAAFTIVQTEAAKKRLERVYQKVHPVIEVIPNGVDVERFKPDGNSELRKQIRRRPGWGEKNLVLYSGGFYALNGVDFLCSLIPRLPRELKKNTGWLFAGHGPLEGLVDKTCGKYPEFCRSLGEIGFEKMPDLYETADLFVIPRPSLAATETLTPLKLLEALSMEKIVLGSDVGGVKEVIEDGVNGFLYRKGDERDFIGRLSWILSNLSNLSRIGKEGRKTVEKNFNWESSRKKLSRLYRKIEQNHKIHY